MILFVGRSWGRAGMALGLALLMSACATLGKPETPEAQVRKLAQARWNAMVAGDLKKAYSLTPPSYRAVTDYKHYLAQFSGSVTWTGAQVLSVTCKPTYCLAKMRVEAKVFSAHGYTPLAPTYFDDRWVPEDGKWWHYER